jgi:DNA repair exonuclease SbcCD ATPase subunit
MAGEVPMRPWVFAVAAAVVAAVLVPSASAQSLAEIAARNNKKKDADKAKPAKVYTEDDLRGRPASSGSMSQMEGPASVAPGAVASPAPGAAAPAGAPAKTEEQERAERETEWRERLAKANEDVTRIQAELDRIQTQLNDISGPLYGGSRTALLSRFEDGQRQLATAKKAVEDLQEEGRRARFR